MLRNTYYEFDLHLIKLALRLCSLNPPFVPPRMNLGRSDLLEGFADFMLMSTFKQFKGGSVVVTLGPKNVESDAYYLEACEHCSIYRTLVIKLIKQLISVLGSI